MLPFISILSTEDAINGVRNHGIRAMTLVLGFIPKAYTWYSTGRITYELHIIRSSSINEMKFVPLVDLAFVY